VRRTSVRVEKEKQNKNFVDEKKNTFSSHSLYSLQTAQGSKIIFIRELFTLHRQKYRSLKYDTAIII